MRIFNIMLKDWMQIFRDWKSGLFLVVMPILFTVFFGLIMGAALNPEPAGDNRLPVGLYNEDLKGSLTPYIEKLLDSSSSIRLIELNDKEISNKNELVNTGEFAAIITIPSNYSADILDDRSPHWTVIVDKTTPAGQTASTAIETTINRLRGAVETARLGAEAYTDQKDFDNPAARQNFMLSSVEQALLEWEQPPLSTRRELATGDAPASGPEGKLDGFMQASSGMMVQFAIFGLITAAMVLVMERKNKTLQRMLTSPVRRWEVIAGHMLAMFVIIFIQETLLIAFGQLAFGVPYMRQPFAVFIMMVTLAWWAASLGLLISALSRSEEQVVTLSLIAMFLFASLGGAWFPLEVAGKTFAKIGHIMPTAWAMDGFQNLLMRGLGLQSIFFPAGMLSIYALAFFGLAIWRFEFE
jgi:ABC-2 type transport system permease protein